MQDIRRFLRFPVIKEVTGMGGTNIYEMIKAGEFPAPYPLRDGGRAVGWASDEVEAWTNSRIKAKADNNAKAKILETLARGREKAKVERTSCDQ